MSCFDCSKAVPKICKADCCGIVPINHLVFHTMKEKIVSDPLELLEMKSGDETVIFPITETGNCCFLRKDYQCNIYEYRPSVCKDFGIIEEMQCPHLKPSGDLRTLEEKKIVKDNMTEYQKNVLLRLKNQ